MPFPYCAKPTRHNRQVPHPIGRLPIGHSNPLILYCTPFASPLAHTSPLTPPPPHTHHPSTSRSVSSRLNPSLPSSYIFSYISTPLPFSTNFLLSSHSPSIAICPLSISLYPPSGILFCHCLRLPLSHCRTDQRFSSPLSPPSCTTSSNAPFRRRCPRLHRPQGHVQALHAQTTCL